MVLRGVDVTVSDPSPTAEAAVAGAPFIQESVPERPALKAAVLAEIEEACGHDAIIASSTSGIRPTALQATMSHPERLVVGHPFNPVYLLPLVEVVAGEATTTAEIDDAITYGFGLRWAQMGLFETYRTAGGDGGFRHFIEQFGPTLAWPWTRLTAVPEFTSELVETIVTQSDAQSGHHRPGELERIRDRNLVGFLQVLERNRWGAGNTLAALRGAEVSRQADPGERQR